MNTCVFCESKDWILENDLAAAFYDQYPVSKGYLLIIPKSHKKTILHYLKQKK